MSATQSTVDSRTAKALVLAEGAGQWIRCRLRDGRQCWGIPSSRPGVYHLTSKARCTCPDAQYLRGGLFCKHVQSLHLALLQGTIRPKVTVPWDEPTIDDRDYRAEKAHFARLGGRMPRAERED